MAWHGSLPFSSPHLRASCPQLCIAPLWSELTCSFPLRLSSSLARLWLRLIVSGASGDDDGHDESDLSGGFSDCALGRRSWSLVAPANSSPLSLTRSLAHSLSLSPLSHSLCVSLSRAAELPSSPTRRQALGPNRDYDAKAFGSV